MELIYNCLYKVDVANQQVSLLPSFAESETVIDYIMTLLDDISGNEGDREYLFDDTLLTMKAYVNAILSGNDRATISRKVASRLLTVETDAQAQIEHLRKEIQKGILIISYAQMTSTEKKLIISKADYTEFIEETSGNKRNGLPTKKKIFKSFVINISSSNGEDDIQKLITYDLNSTRAIYWWKTFLELKEIRDDEENTKSAFNGITTKILNPIRKTHKADYLCLWNATIAYLRGEGEFDLNYYRDNIVGVYTPFDSALDINALKIKINKLPEQCKFDVHFIKKPSVVSGKFKNTIKLTDEVDLVIKHDIPSVERIIKSHLDDEGKKYIMIRSDIGYEYANNIEQINGN